MRTLPCLTLILLSTAAAGGAAPLPDEQAIRRAYQELEQALLKKDSATVMRIHAPEFEGWGPRLEALNPEALTEAFAAMKAGKLVLSPLKFVRSGPDYLVTSEMSSVGTYTMEGQQVPVEQTQRGVDHWRKVNGRWQIVGTQVLQAEVKMAGRTQKVVSPAPLTETERVALRSALRPLLQPVRVDPAAPATDLGFLRPLASARLIGVGEGSHGTREHFLLKARIFKALVEEHGFTTLAFEANLPSERAVNAYISGESDDLTAALKALGMVIWRTEEIRDLLRWMRDYNARRGDRPALNYVAIDMQDPMGSARLLQERGGTLAGALKPFGELKTYEVAEKMKDAAQQKVYLQAAQAAVQAAQALAPETAERAELLRLARNVQQGVLGMAGQPRDTFMAENMLDWLRAHPQARVMLWAHNRHVTRQPEEISKNFDLGQRLAQALGAQYRVIGQSYAGGSVSATVSSGAPQPVALAAAHPDSLDALAAASSSAEATALVLTEAQGTPALRQYLAVPRPIRSVAASAVPGMMGYSFEALPAAYDVLLLTRTSTPARPVR